MSTQGSRPGLTVAIVGATGVVGRELLSILEEREFPVDELILFASSRSVGKALSFRDKTYLCKALKPGCFKGVDIAFFDASDSVSKEWVPRAAEDGAWVVDNSGQFRLEDGIPLLVPEINGALLEERIQKFAREGQASDRILTGPNCSTVQMVMALKPLHDQWTLKRVVVSTYQSVSGAGSAAVEELSHQTVGMFNQREVPPQAFKYPIAFNCIPHIGSFGQDGYTSEELKIIAETRKILNLPQLLVTATAVRVPTFSCHCESVNIEFETPFELNEVRRVLDNYPGVQVVDDLDQFLYPMPRAMGDAPEGVMGTGKDGVYVGRIRRDFSVPNGLNLWVVSDNIRKGAALNAVQIGERLVQSLA